MAAPTSQPAKHQPFRRVCAALLVPQWLKRHFILAPLWLLSDGSQRLRIDVNSIGDDLEDGSFLLGGFVAFGLLMSFLNVFRLIHRKRKKPLLSGPELLLREMKKDHSPRGQWMAADLEQRIANGLPLSDTLMPQSFPAGPPPGYPPGYQPPRSS